MESSLTIRTPDLFPGRTRREAPLDAPSPERGAFGTWGAEFITKIKLRPRREAPLDAPSPEREAFGTWGC